MESPAFLHLLSYPGQLIVLQSPDEACVVTKKRQVDAGLFTEI